MKKGSLRIVFILMLCLISSGLLCACMNKKVEETTLDDSTSIQYTKQAETTRAQPKTTAKEETTTKEKNNEGKSRIMYCIWPEDANVRAGASTDDDILGVISYGTQVKVIENVKEDGNDTGWLKIDYNGQTAYVWGELFSTDQPGGDYFDYDDDDEENAAEEIEEIEEIIEIEEEYEED